MELIKRIAEAVLIVLGVAVGIAFLIAMLHTAHECTANKNQDACDAIDTFEMLAD